jgi:integrase
MDKLAPYNERAKKLKYNKDYYFAFVELLSSEKAEGKIRGNTPVVYTNKIIGFLEYLDKQGLGINKTTKHDISEYARIKNKTINSVFQSALKRIFAIVKNPSVTNQDIEELKTKKRTSRNATPLVPAEIIEIRNKLKRNNQYQLLFTFEMFFVYGIKLAQFRKLQRKDFSVEENSFEIEPQRKVLLNKILFELISKHSDIPNPRVSGVQTNIRKIGALTERDKLIWEDIIETRETYFPLCPNCKEKYPSTDDFWVLVIDELDYFKTKWLLCRNCASKLTGRKTNE